MPELLRTTSEGKGRASHYHILYLNETTGVGETSVSANHSHPVRYQVNEPIVQSDEMTGDPVMLAEGSEGWIIEAAGKDGHIHEPMPYEPTAKEEKEKPEDTVISVLKSYKSCRDLEEKNIKSGQECEGYYWGDKQWDETQAKELNEVGRAANTFNLIGKNVDELGGHQKQARTMPVFLPTEEGDQAGCDILKIVVSNILEQCNYQREKSNVFLDEAITGRGSFNVYMDLAKNFKNGGDIVIEQYQWDNFYCGPHTRDDLEDCEELVKWKWYSEERIKEEYPDQYPKLSPEAIYDILDDEAERHDLVDSMKKKYKLLERWRKIFKRTMIIVNGEDDFYFNAEGWKKSDISAAKSIPGFNTIPYTNTKIRITRVIGNAFIDDENPSDLEVDDYYLVPVYGKRRKGKFKGVVFDALDSQDDLNKRHSQSIDIGNKLVSSITYIDSNTFSDSVKDEEDFKKNAGSPAYVAKITDTNRPPVRVDPPVFPEAMVRLLELGEMRLSQIMNTHPEPVGANDSGVALLQKQRIKLIGNEFLFDNMTFAEKKVIKIVVALIQKHYSVDRIMRIIAKEANKDGEDADMATINGKAVNEYTPEEVKAMLENADFSKYDMTISEAQWTPTERLANLMILKEMDGVPPDMLIEFMDNMPKRLKTRLIKGIQEMRQAQMQSEQAKNMVEIEKTKIAHGAGQPGTTPQGV